MTIDYNDKKPRMRPRFEIEMDVPRHAFIDALKNGLSEENAPVYGHVFSHNADLRVLVKEEHFWSPHLDLFIEECPHCKLRGRFAPHPNIWTGFMAIYATLSMIALGALVYGYSQWSVGQSPWALWIVPAAIALIGFVYGAAFIGQGLGAEQMYELRSFVDHALEKAGEAYPSSPPPATNAEQ